MTLENKKPKVSVCVMTYNQKPYIEQCLQSIVDQVTNFDFEIIVADDCSDDGTRDIVKKFSNSYPELLKSILHESNIGACKNYISVHTAARGEYIAHIDGDDYALPGKIQAIADAFDANSNINIVYHRMRIRSEIQNIECDDLLSSNFVKRRRFKRADILALGSIGCNSGKSYRASSRLSKFPEYEFIDYFIDIEQIGDGEALLLDDVLGGYRIGIGISADNKTRNIYLDTLSGALKKYPEFSAEICCNALTCFLLDLKNKRSTWKDFLILAFRSRKIIAIYIFLKWLNYRRFTRTNIIETK